MISLDEIINRLDLQPMPEEGGFYRETYRAEEIIPMQGLPSRYKSSKNFCTAIYYLLTPETRSALHRLPTDEIFHFYLGDSVEMLQLFPDGTSKIVALGSKIELGEQLQVIVPRNVWQGTILKKGGKFALMGVTVAPAFDFSDYEAGDNSLLEKYPDRKKIIEKLI